MKLTTLSLILASLSAASLSACMDRDSGPEADSAEQSIDQTEALEAEGNMMMESLDGADVSGVAGLTADDAATRIAANIRARWSPATCITVTQTGANIRVDYNDCTGPRRLGHVTGRLDLVVAVDLAGVITVQGTSDSLRVNNADLAVDVTATYTRTGTGRTVEVHSRGSGIGQRGNAIEHEGDYAITRDGVTQCGRLEGHWQADLSGAAGSAERSTDVDLRRCAGGCPTGTVTRRGLRDITTTITFDGTPTARWTRSSGETGEVTLTCE